MFGAFALARAGFGGLRWLWICSSLLLLAIGFLPLFAGPSYEFALACGVILPLLGAGFCAWRSVHDAPTLLGAFHLGQTRGLTLAALALLVALVHGVRAGMCDPWAELAFFAIGPLPGAVLACLWGSLCGACFADPVRPRRAATWALALALAAPLLGIVASLLRYYTSPIIFAFDPFFGYFSGTLYDTVIDGVPRLLSYRAGSLGWVLVVYALASSSYRRADGRLTLRAHPSKFVVATFGLCLGGGVFWFGPELGHYQTDASVQRALGRAAETPRCKVYYAAGIRQRDAHALARDCDAHIEQHERFFEVRAPERAHVYLFNSAEQKAWLMGARDVYIAKPWRQEIYIQARSYPHPVLGHELAHVVAGAFGTGPFKVAGPLGGWIPDPGRIEGVAVAAAPREDDDLTLLQWAQAMQQLELLPPLAKVFRLGFLGENSSKAYTVAGAFMTWLRERHGAAAVRAWYGGASLEDLTSQSLPQLDAAFRADLSKLEISPKAMAVARARFDRPGLFARRCPHQVDLALSEAANALGGFDPELARQKYEQVLKLSPDEFAAAAGLGACELRKGELAAAQRHYEELLAKANLSTPERAALQQVLGDVAFAQGDFKAALTRYAAATEHVLDQDELRTLAVKQMVLPAGEHTELARVAVEALLIGDPTTGPNWPVAAAELGRWSQVNSKDGAADYLLGKGYAGRGEWEQASSELDRALKKGISQPLLRAEALRTRLFMACALGQKAAGKDALNRYLQQTEQSPARRQGVQRFAERCGLTEPQASPKAGVE